MNLLSTLNPTDLDAYAHLPRSVKDEATAWFSLISDLSSPSVPSCKISVIRRHAARLGKSVAQCTRKYYEWTNGTGLYPAGDWRILINRRKAGPAWYSSLALDHAHARALPAAFVEYWRSLCEQNQRGKCDPQYDALLRQLARWRKGDPAAAIPGYDSPPPNDESGHHPKGWSYRNLMRHKPLKIEQTLANIGIAAASQLLPPVPGTRVGARWLEYVFFDDVFNDRKCIVPGYRDPARILQLGSHDYASAVYLEFGQRPEIPNPNDPGSVERLKETEMKFLVASFLEKYGYPADYDIFLILERGTATLRPADARALFDLSNGRIKCCYTSMQGGLVLIFEDRSTGNPRGKASLESWHNLFHNECAALAGQIGKDRDHSPAELQGRERAAVALNTAAALLTPEQRARLRLPFPSVRQALFETKAVVNIINNRTRHNLEGFDEVLLWRIKGTGMDWRPESELLALDPALAPALEYSTRKESPLERMAKLSAGVKFNKLPPGMIYSLFYEQSHVLVKSDGFQIEFTRNGRPYRFLPPDDANLPPGEYLGYFNPQDISRIHLTSNGAYRATWELETKIGRGDRAGLSAAIARKQRQLNTHLGAVRRRHADLIEQREADLRTNLAVLDEAGIAPARIAGEHGREADSMDGPAAHNLSSLITSPLITDHSPLSQAIAAHQQTKQTAQAAQRAEAQLADLADEALLANIQPELD